MKESNFINHVETYLIRTMNGKTQSSLYLYSLGAYKAFSAYFKLFQNSNDAEFTA